MIEIVRTLTMQKVNSHKENSLNWFCLPHSTRNNFIIRALHTFIGNVNVNGITICVSKTFQVIL